MTTTRRPVQVTHETSVLRTASVAWEIAPDALAAAGRATLTWTIDLDAATAHATLDLDGRVRTLRECSVTIERDPSGLTHVAAPESLLLAAIRPDGTPLYARTSLLATLGVPGGRYEVVGFDRQR